MQTVGDSYRCIHTGDTFNKLYYVCSNEEAQNFIIQMVMFRLIFNFQSSTTFKDLQKFSLNFWMNWQISHSGLSWCLIRSLPYSVVFQSSTWILAKLYFTLYISCLNSWTITLLLLLPSMNFPEEIHCLKRLSSAEISFISGS